MASFLKRDLVTSVESVVEGKRFPGRTVGHGLGTNPIAYTFPTDLSAHFMSLVIKRHVVTTPGDSSLHFHKCILLPIPQNLQDSFQVDYAQGELGAVGGKLADTLAGADLGNIGKDIGDSIKSFYGGAYDTGYKMAKEGGAQEAMTTMAKDEDLTTMISSSFRGNVNPIGVTLNRFFGVVPNPNITAMFRGVGLKTHNLSWKLSPANEDESEMITNIIKILRASMLPKRSEKGFALSFPDEVEISIGGNISDNQYFHFPFKAAVIQNATFNYTPDGTPSFFGRTGAPTAVSITLDLLENSIHTRDDYENAEPGGTAHSKFEGVDSKRHF